MEGDERGEKTECIYMYEVRSRRMWDRNRNAEATIKHRYEESEYKSSEATIWSKEESIKREKKKRKQRGER